MWAYTCVKRVSYFWVSFAVGKWTQETCKAMFSKVAKRLQSPTFTDRLEIFSDGNDDYTFVMPEFFHRDSIDYAQLIKIRRGGRVIAKVRRRIFGFPGRADIETTDVENFNGIIRERVGRFVRRTKCYAKRLGCLSNALGVFQFFWNFMKPIKDGLTPAMLEGQATKVWRWGNFLNAHLRYVN